MWSMPVICPGTRRLRRWERSRCLWESQYRISRKVQSYPCRYVQRERINHALFINGVLSGIVEPIGAILTILAAGFIVPALPYLLSFAAGAMLYVVVEELIPEMLQGKHSNIGTVLFAVGFSLMMVLDVALG